MWFEKHAFCMYKKFWWYVVLLIIIYIIAKMYAGMNTEGYDWKNFVLNTFRWLTNYSEE